MKNILVIGGGAMGSAFTIPCLQKNNKVTITEPHSKTFIKDLSSKSKFHSSLQIKLSKKLKFQYFSNKLLNKKFDLIVIALSLSGIDFIGKKLRNLKIKTPILVLTKGLKYEKKVNKVLTISEQLKENNKNMNISVLKGPCLANELVRKNKITKHKLSPDYNNKRLIGFEKNIKLQWSTEDINKNGIIGNPANASSKKGEELTNIVTSTLKKIIIELKLL